MSVPFKNKNISYDSAHITNNLYFFISNSLWIRFISRTHVP